MRLRTFPVELLDTLAVKDAPFARRLQTEYHQIIGLLLQDWYRLTGILGINGAGEEVTIAKNNLPIVDLVPHKPRGKRRLRLLRGKIEVKEDLDAPSEEIETLFYGE